MLTKSLPPRFEVERHELSPTSPWPRPRAGWPCEGRPCCRSAPSLGASSASPVANQCVRHCGASPSVDRPKCFSRCSVCGGPDAMRRGRAGERLVQAIHCRALFEIHGTRRIPHRPGWWCWWWWSPIIESAARATARSRCAGSVRHHQALRRGPGHRPDCANGRLARTGRASHLGHHQPDVVQGEGLVRPAVASQGLWPAYPHRRALVCPARAPHAAQSASGAVSGPGRARPCLNAAGASWHPACCPRAGEEIAAALAPARPQRDLAVAGTDAMKTGAPPRRDATSTDPRPGSGGARGCRDSRSAFRRPEWAVRSGHGNVPTSGSTHLKVAHRGAAPPGVRFPAGASAHPRDAGALTRWGPGAWGDGPAVELARDRRSKRWRGRQAKSPRTATRP